MIIFCFIIIGLVLFLALVVLLVFWFLKKGQTPAVPVAPAPIERRVRRFNLRPWLAWFKNNLLLYGVFLAVFAFFWPKTFAFWWQQWYFFWGVQAVVLLFAWLGQTKWLNYLAVIAIAGLTLFSTARVGWQNYLGPRRAGFRKVVLSDRYWSELAEPVAGNMVVQFLEGRTPLTEVEYQLAKTTASATLQPKQTDGKWLAFLENPTTGALELRLKLADTAATEPLAGSVWYKILPKMTSSKEAVARRSQWFTDDNGILTARLNPGEWTSAIFRLEPDQNSPWIRILSDHYRFMAEDRNHKIFFIQPGRGKDFIEVKPDKELSLPINSGVMLLRFKGGQEGSEVVLSVHRLNGGMIRRDS